MDITTPTTSRVRSPEVMVSYSSQDRERVMQFVRALRGSGVAVWIDQGGIDGAQRWSEEIVNAIEACRTVLLFLSRSSMESQNIAKEVALAWESGKHFLPVALEEVKIPKSMQYQLAGIQYVKLFEGDPDAKFESVLRALVRLGVRVSPYSMAVVSAGMGDREQAFEWLEKACEERSAGLSKLKSEPRFNSMRSDARFVELAKRADALALELEDATAEIVPQRPLAPANTRETPSSGPGWKRLLWPDVVDAKSAREAAGQGVWAAVALIACFWILSFLVPTPMITVKSWWNDPIVLTVIWGVIGFSVQKMGRPAAIAGAVLCVLGAWFNLSVLPFYKAAMEQQQIYTRMGQTLPGQPDYSALYYATLFGVAAGIVFIVAFVNASRGTMAYRHMVVAGKTEDKQDALSSQDLLAVRRKVMGTVQRIWKSRPLAAPPVQVESASSVTALPLLSRSFMTQHSATLPTSVATDTTAHAVPVVLSPSSTSNLPQSNLPALKAPQSIDRFPEFGDAPDVHTLGDLVGSNPFRVMRAIAFLVANVTTGMVFMLSRSLLLPGRLHPVYWQFALLHGLAVTLATVLAFRFVRSGWIASVVAAASTIVLILPVYHFTLGTFAIADILYREQFQEFVLIPFVDVLVTLLGLFYLIPRVRPLALGLWVGAVSAEVVTSMLITTLRDFGSGPAPDSVLAGTLVFFVGVRSLVFAAVFWAGLKMTMTKIGKAAGR